MYQTALLLDLDNTIYHAADAGPELFAPLVKIIQSSGEYRGNVAEFTALLFRKPFHFVAEHYGFSELLTSSCLEILQSLTCSVELMPFPDYSYLRGLPLKKYLITAGFTRLQMSKIEALGIGKDFEKIFIVDRMHAEHSKKTCFKKIMDDHDYQSSSLLAIGDDPASELQAAADLGIAGILYDSLDLFPDAPYHRIKSFYELAQLFQ